MGSAEAASSAEEALGIGLVVDVRGASGKCSVFSLPVLLAEPTLSTTVRMRSINGATSKQNYAKI